MMKTLVSISLSAVLAFTAMQSAMAETEAKNIVRTDRMIISKHANKAPVAQPKTKRTMRTDRVSYNFPVMEQPSLQKKYSVRTDRVSVPKADL